MSLPIRRILWAGNDDDHDDHLHVEGDPSGTGTPPLTNPGMTPALQTIMAALVSEFGDTAYFLDDDAEDAGWTNMGYYNRRKIAGSDTWSQHAYANAVDIGKYMGVAAQRPFYEFLTNYEEDEVALTTEEENFVKALYAKEKATGTFSKDIITRDELNAALTQVGGLTEKRVKDIIRATRLTPPTN